MCATVILRICVIAMAVSVATQATSAGQAPQVIAKEYYNTFSRAHPVLARIQPGQVVRTKTIDASGRDEAGMVRARPSIR